MKRTLICLAAFGMLLSSGVQAMPGYGHSPTYRGGAAAMQQEVGPGMILREGVTKLLKFMRQSDQPNPQRIAAFLETEIAPYFDFDYMADWAAGPMKRYMTEQQKAELGQQVKQLLLGTLAKRLGDYNNQDVRFYRPRSSGRNEVKVRVGILQAGGYPANIDFRFYRSESGWKVFDVAANGNSALAYYRQHFSSKMRSQSPDRGYRR
ncbi:MAG: ABC transporter substrate-binding protein [Candidatus Thiodiazotropha taylori]|nr:ABC transporter substrate-binding protein [Candidatus Thiodiazotropha endolucinida]MCW4322372.1 ABC transporter substrate-binding protein [Candidatus Thiodiazotropha taylori]